MFGGVGTDTNCPILIPRSVSDGGERARRRRTTNHATTPVIKATPTMPPTMPPVIVPAFELLCEVAVDDGLVCGVEVDNELLCEVEVDDEPPDTPGITLDCKTWVVDVGTTEDVPVTSGESTRQVNICACRGPPIAPPLACAAETFQVSSCEGMYRTVDDISRERK